MEEAGEARREKRQKRQVKAGGMVAGAGGLVDSWRRGFAGVDARLLLLTTLPTCSKKTSAKGSNLMIDEHERG